MYQLHVQPYAVLGEVQLGPHMDVRQCRLLSYDFPWAMDMSEYENTGP